MKFMVDERKDGEGNIEINISDRGNNINKKVNKKGNERFDVSFINIENNDNVIRIKLKKESVKGYKFVDNVKGD